MPKVNFAASFRSRQEITLELTDQEWTDLQSGVKKYYDFLDSHDYDSGEWLEGEVYNQDTLEWLD